jgi:acyl carrier protein
LCDKVARVLGTSPDRLDANTTLLQLGIDSLMAVELRNWLEAELQVDLPIVELMRSPSVMGLAELLAERLEPAVTAAAKLAVFDRRRVDPGSVQRGAIHISMAERANEWSADIDDLSGDQVDALLVALLGEKGYVHAR